MKKYYEIFPNGCSELQRDKLRNTWFEMYGNPYTDNIEWSDEVKQLDEMDSTLDMLDSLFAYNPFWKSEFYRKGSAERLGAGWQISSYYDYFFTHYKNVGGKKVDFDKMLKIQFEHLNKCVVLSNVHTDLEGVSYNSISENTEVIGGLI